MTKAHEASLAASLLIQRWAEDYGVRIEIKLPNRPAMKQFFVIALISLTPAESDRWTILHRIGAEAAANVTG